MPAFSQHQCHFVFLEPRRFRAVIFSTSQNYFFLFENRRLWSSLPSNSVLFLNTQNPKSHFLQDIFLKYLRKNPAAILRVPQRMWHYANLIKEVDFAGIYHICDVACCVLRAACGLFWGRLGGGGIVDCANMWILGTTWGLSIQLHIFPRSEGVFDVGYFITLSVG